jgi:hypothetical protein
VVEYSKSDEGSDMRLMVKLVTEFGAERIRNALKGMPKEEDADLVVSTAHKSKGREWDTVRLGQDFPTANKMSDPDRRLLYVAATRAKLVLDISECPPFCGGEDRSGDGESGGWVPGLRVRYTAPIPTAGETAAFAAAARTAPGTPSRPATASNPPAPISGPNGTPDAATAVQAPANGNGGSHLQHNAGEDFTWANMDGRWCVRGPKDQPVGKTVTVVRKNGTQSQETLRGVTRKIGDLWFYTV